MNSVTSHIVIAQERPDVPDIKALLADSEAYLSSLYAEEENFFLTVEELIAQEIRFFTARIEGTVVGCVGYGAYDGYAEIKRFQVREEARGQGIGQKLMEMLEKAAIEEGFTVFRLETGTKQEASHRLYARFGYQVRGPYGEYPGSPASIFMEKIL